MEAIARCIVLTGPECSGKTTLAGELARHYDAPWVPEYAREYATALERPLVYADVEPIARGQRAAEDAASRSGRLLLLDTDLLSTVVYSRYCYGACPAWIEREAVARRGDLYLLHQPDIPWVAEPGLREASDRRAEQSKLFRDVLAASGAVVVEIRGAWPERLAKAIAAIDERLGRP